ncbi:exo-alpha-sialidase [Parabacteroides sp. OttesenSCG-928-N08]|nr:exo-alpha-sialidase [Parabacteroides sp. OttesenSCG-928-N08]
MKKSIISLCLLAISVASFASDTIWVKHPQIPVLIDRVDNVLCYLRVEAERGERFDEVKLRLTGDFRPEEVKAIKLYYGGIERAERKNSFHYAPVDYISKDMPGKTLIANPAYSVMQSMTTDIEGEISLSSQQPLMPGVNYFWVSIEMQRHTSLLSTMTAEVTEVTINGKSRLLHPATDQPIVRRMGIGVRHAGDDGSAAFRIPGLVTTNAGTLLGVYDVRYNNSADLQEYVDVGLSRSRDGGQTWEAMRLPLSFGEQGGLPKGQNGVGDPAILVDKQTGTIWVVAAWTHGMGNGRAWFNSQQGMELHETAQLMMARSDDDGQSWSEPINVTSQLKQPEWFFLLQGPGNGISMEDGTLVFASQYIGADRIPNAGIMYSKDHGKTWQMNQPARVNTTEAQVAEIEPGVLMLNMRDNRGGSRAVSITKNMGQSWTEHPSSRSALPEPVCMASLIHCKATDNSLGRDILLFSNPNTTKERKDITIKASLDGGVTWLEKHQLLLDEDYNWGYSCLTMIDRETVGILYEGSTAHMVFQAIRLKDIIEEGNR